jgi:hypothetical protein
MDTKTDKIFQWSIYGGQQVYLPWQQDLNPKLVLSSYIENFLVSHFPFNINTKQMYEDFAYLKC